MINKEYTEGNVIGMIISLMKIIEFRILMNTLNALFMKKQENL